MGRIWDVTEADLSNLSNNSILMASNYSNMFRSGVKDVKVALVSENKNNIELLQVFKAYTRNTELEVEVFESIKEAEVWISTRR
ncbi:hypothetical protein KJ966_28575 [bacterium]|nr:hypothetical protein [bacterium]